MMEVQLSIESHQSFTALSYQPQLMSPREREELQVLLVIHVVSFGGLIVGIGRLGAGMGKTNGRPQKTRGDVPVGMMIVNGEIMIEMRMTHGTSRVGKGYVRSLSSLGDTMSNGESHTGGCRRTCLVNLGQHETFQRLGTRGPRCFFVGGLLNRHGLSMVDVTPFRSIERVEWAGDAFHPRVHPQ